MQLGYVGLGKMGLNMVDRLIGHGHVLVTYDPSTEAVDRAVTLGASGVTTFQELVAAVAVPRTIWLMVPHQAVDAVIGSLVPLLTPGDTIIDGGNSPYQETIRRARELSVHGIELVDVGTSGGPEGARDGACLMVGGQRESYDRLVPLFHDIAVANGYGYMGASGAGHFVKMVHNGIEYGMMQAIAEGFALMHASPFGLDVQAVAHMYNQQSVITSRLTEWLERAYMQEGSELESVSGAVAQSGEGLWTLEAARELGIAMPVIEASVEFRTRSQENPSYAGQVVSALRNQFGGHVVKQ